MTLQEGIEGSGMQPLGLVKPCSKDDERFEVEFESMAIQEKDGERFKIPQ